MKKVLATIAMLAIPGMAMAIGLIGDCYDCHTMHNSESNQPVAQVSNAGVLTTTATPNENLLKLDCMACHANNPSGGSAILILPGGSEVPQVAHGGATDLAGGNFSYGLGGNGTVDKVHNVKELFAAGIESNSTTGNPPGMYNGHANVFSSTTNAADLFDEFGCAGASGCHGTRAQILIDATNSTPAVKRTGFAAIAGSHHNSYDGAKDATNYAGAQVHDGDKVAEGYRFIVGLKGYGNETDRWQNVDATSHNEYYGDATGINTAACNSCHQGFTATDSNLMTPNNSMSGFCSTCHGMFHSAGGGDFEANGVSGAFLRHPSDWVLPAGTTEYANYVNYDLSAPVARPTLATSASAVVTPGTDMVMCLSCHQAHGSANDYILRFDYGTMYAGGSVDLAASQALGGCMACHTEKGVAQ